MSLRQSGHSLNAILSCVLSSLHSPQVRHVELQDIRTASRCAVGRWPDPRNMTKVRRNTVARFSFASSEEHSLTNGFQATFYRMLAPIIKLAD